MQRIIREVATKELIRHGHLTFEWLAVKQLKKLDWATADLSIINQLIKLQS